MLVTNYEKVDKLGKTLKGLSIRKGKRPKLVVG
jgi:hypothetical protein